MAWGMKCGVDDLLAKLRQPSTGKSLFVLSTRKLSEEDAQKLAKAIAQSHLLQELYLSGHRLGHDSITAFAECLAVNDTLAHLSLGHESFGDEELDILSKAIASNAHSALRIWDLEKKSITAKGLLSLAKLLESPNCKLSKLILSRNAVQNQGLKYLCDALAGNTGSVLEELQMHETSLTLAAFDALANVLRQTTCRVRVLDMSLNDLSHKDEEPSSTFFDALRGNNSLQELHLRSCQLTDSFAIALAQALADHQSLRIIDLSDNKLTAKGTVAIATALGSNSSLQRLSLGNNVAIGDEGAGAIGQTLDATNRSLEFLDLSQTSLSHSSMTQLLASPSLKELRLFHNQLGDGLNHVIAALQLNSCLETLDLGANKLHGALSVALFDSLHSHRHLKTLEMGGNDLGEEGHAALERLRNANGQLDVAVDKNVQQQEDDMPPFPMQR